MSEQQTGTVTAVDDNPAVTEFSEAAYEAVMTSLAGVARSVAGLPLDKVLLSIDRAESLGPILFPTEYRNSGTALRDQRELVEAFVGVQRAVENIKARAS